MKKYSFFVLLVSFLYGFRDFEPIVIIGENLNVFAGVPIHELHLFRYTETGWSEIPVQIDERNSEGSFFFSDDGLLDDNDEISFQPQDGGISTGIWLNYEKSKAFPRVKIEIRDPFSSDNKVVYLYRCPELGDTLSKEYVGYEDSNDAIWLNHSIRIGFDNEKKFMDELTIDRGPDILDRSKFRMQGNGILGTWTVTEEDQSPESLLIKKGRVRILRWLKTKVEVVGIEQIVYSLTEYYRNFVQVPGDTLPIPEGNIDFVRTSMDLTVNSLESDENNSSIQADGVIDDGIHYDVYDNQIKHKWFKIKTDYINLLTVGDYSGISDEPKIYYYDNEQGGSADGTDDTGDNKSIGDIGMFFPSPSSGTHIIRTNIYFSKSDLKGEEVKDYFDHPLDVDVKEEFYEEILEDAFQKTENIYYNGSFHIYGVEGMEEVYLYNLTGGLIIKSKTSTVNCKNLCSGIYFLIIKTKTGVIEEKFLLFK